ncbi:MULTISPECIES: hypothetical protein [Candidatus Ichthyocystis]|uniref:hypothetical protein n=1 Tax=Candidatus Ichthyocystis TaxID=2929841 RepID=UPI000B83DA86|nr:MULTISPECIES: hypothetical protein [Ichthyocystis]
MLRNIFSGLVFFTALSLGEAVLAAVELPCDVVTFSAVGPGGSSYYLTGSLDYDVSLHRGFDRGNPTDSQAWELRSTYPVPSDKSSATRTPWINVFWMKSGDAGGGSSMPERYFLSLSDSMYVDDKEEPSLILYPAPLGYYANVNARVDFRHASGDTRLHMVLRNTGLYVVPDWKSRDSGFVPISLKLTPEGFPGWVASNWRGGPGICSSVILSRNSGRNSGRPYVPVF